jgi:chemotaxis protein methyltransferase CheR
MSHFAQTITATDTLHLTSAGFTRLARYITTELGIKMPDSKISMIQSRLMRRVRELGLQSVEEYGNYLFSARHEDERDHFINAITTNKTDFFREQEHFSYLTATALPLLAAIGETNYCQTKIWSAACSTGEEPYTLAIVLNEYARLNAGANFRILATDVSTRVLEKARQAIYSAEQAAAIPAELRKKYLLQSRDGDSNLVRITPELRKTISFHRLNLISDDYQINDRFDVVFLRNVLIYFDRIVQEAVVNHICRYLNPGGYLFVGHSESLSELRIPVRRVHTSVFQMPR